MFKCTYFSGPHTSQTGERIFKTLDDLKTGSTSVSEKHLSQRLLHAMNNVKGESSVPQEAGRSTSSREDDAEGQCEGQHRGSGDRG
jgi:hypothetical protein